ncbi:MAG: HAD-IC family P-type ATPase, partial [TACK group archaeon]|nr:HAD-IC family P-type ATPase [TACK group archaeon]
MSRTRRRRFSEDTARKLQKLAEEPGATLTSFFEGGSSTAVSFVAWVELGASSAEALLFAVAVLASACPCALGLATPMAVLTTVNRLAKRGITVKNGESLEKLREVRTFVFDKTGTLTTGSVEVKRTEELLPGALALAAAVEAMSSHPLAAAISQLGGSRGWVLQGAPAGASQPAAGGPSGRGAASRDLAGLQVEAPSASGPGGAGVDEAAQTSEGAPGGQEAGGAKTPLSLPLEVKDFSEFPGEGVYGRVAGHDVLVGKAEFARKNAQEALGREGKEEEGDVVVLVDWRPAAYLWVGESLREGVKETLEALKLDHRVVVATGDSSASA